MVMWHIWGWACPGDHCHPNPSLRVWCGGGVASEVGGVIEFHSSRGWHSSLASGNGIHEMDISSHDSMGMVEFEYSCMSIF